jgi:hypothetical protein
MRILTCLLFLVLLTSCSTKESNEVSVGEVYENEATAIGIVFPPEYIGKYKIIQYDVDSFSVFHRASYMLYEENESKDETSKVLGWLFGIERWPVSSEDDIRNKIERATQLFQTDDYVYFISRPTGVEYDEGIPEPWQTTEYKVLFTDAMIDSIIASAYIIGD